MKNNVNKIFVSILFVTFAHASQENNSTKSEDSPQQVKTTEKNLTEQKSSLPESCEHLAPFIESTPIQQIILSYLSWEKIDSLKIEAPIGAIAWEPHENCFFTIDVDRRIISWKCDAKGKWEKASSTQIAPADNKSDDFSGAAFSPDGKYVIKVAGLELIEIWKKNNANEWTMQQKESTETGSIIFSPDGGFFIALGPRWGHIWKRDNNNQWHKQKEIRDSEYYLLGSVAFSPNSRYVALAVFRGAKRKIRIWELNNESQRWVRGIDIIPDYYSALVWSPDSQALITSSNDKPGTIRIWQRNEKNQFERIKKYQNLMPPAGKLLWSPDGKYIVGRFNEEVYVLSYNNKELARETYIPPTDFFPNDYRAPEIAISADGNYVACVCQYGDTKRTKEIGKIDFFAHQARQLLVPTKK